MKHIKAFQLAAGLVPDGKIGKLTLGAMLKLWGLNKEQLANYLGHTHIESQGFEKDTENLNYSKERLLVIFKNDFDTNKDRVLSETEKRLAEMLAHKPEAIGNFVYANQNGNGGVNSGDGYLMRGRGSLMTTGRGNYLLLSNFVKDPEVMKNPALVATKYYWESGLFYFTKNNLWSLSKKVDDATSKKLTLAINGGYNHLKERTEMTKYYYGILKNM